MPLDQLHEVERGSQAKGEMTFLEHIIELRKHIVRSVLAIFAGALVVFFNKDFVFKEIIFGPRSPDFPTFRALCWVSHKAGLGESMCITPSKFEVMTRELGEALMVHISVSIWMGVIVAFPFILYEIWKFVAPGLKDSEIKAARNLIGVCSLLFFIGVLFGYYIIAPFSISFLGGYTIEGMSITPTLSSYVNYVIMFTLPTGLIFELPVASYFLAKIGLLTPAAMRTYWRHAVVVIFVFAAIITPPDVVAQCLTAIPLIILYEISIRVAGAVQRKKLEKERLDALNP